MITYNKEILNFIEKQSTNVCNTILNDYSRLRKFWNMWRY